MVAGEGLGIRWMQIQSASLRSSARISSSERKLWLRPAASQNCPTEAVRAQGGFAQACPRTSLSATG